MANPVIRGGNHASPQSIYGSTSVNYHGLGTVGVLGERTFVWSKNTGVAIGKGVVCRNAAAEANHVSVAWLSGGAAGAKTVTVTLGATAATLNEYADGWIAAIDGTGSGNLFKIKSHPAADSAATLELTLYDEIDVAFGTGEVSLIESQYAAVATTAGNVAAHVVGVTPSIISAGSTTPQFFWLQTGGPCMVLGDGSTFVAGEMVTYAIAGTADAGQCTITTGTTTTGQPALGYIIDLGDAGSDLDFRFVHLTLRF